LVELPVEVHSAIEAMKLRRDSTILSVKFSKAGNADVPGQDAGTSRRPGAGHGRMSHPDPPLDLLVS
jgi:hypothetical protein